MSKDTNQCICRNYDKSGYDQHGGYTCPVHTNQSIDELITELRGGTINFDDEANHAIKQLLATEVIRELTKMYDEWGVGKNEQYAHMDWESYIEHRIAYWNKTANKEEG